MKRDVNHALDECLALLGEGRATLEECLARYPEYASDLVPLLEIAIQVRNVSQPPPDPVAFAAGKRRMLETLAEKKRRQAVFPTPHSRNIGWIATVLGGKAIPTAWRSTLASRLALAGGMVLALLAAGSLVLLSSPGTKMEGVARMATLDRAEGVVGLLPTGSDTWQPASAGEHVEVGSRIRTGPGSAAVLVFFDGSTTELEAETEIAVIEMSSPQGNDRVILLEQALGQTYSRVQRAPDRVSRFEIATSTAVVAVRGTEFSTAVEMDGTTRVAVVEGAVEVTAQGTTVVVLVGQKIAVHPGQIPGNPVLKPQATPTPESTPTPTSTPTVRAVPAPTATPRPKSTVQPADPMVTLQPAGQDVSPQPPDVTKTHQPPGLTKTPQPPGQTKTPQPPGQEKPKPDHEKKPKPAKKP
jgi:hypothetical protein